MKVLHFHIYFFQDIYQRKNNGKLLSCAILNEKPNCNEFFLFTEKKNVKKHC